MLAGNEIVACLGLFLLTLAHEETAIIAGGYLIAEHELDVGVANLALTLGVIAGDWAIYGLGAAAGRMPPLRRWIRSTNLVRSRDWLRQHLLFVIVVARLFPGPGILFPVFSGLGLLHAGFPRFALRSALVAAVYTPAMLYLTVLYGDAVVPLSGWPGWVALLVVPAILMTGPWARPFRRRAAALVGIDAAARDAGSSCPG